jgi:hypothetical protein
MTRKRKSCDCIEGRTETPAGIGRRDAVVIPVAVGELADKITILEIKAERISEPAKSVISAPSCSSYA